MSFFIGSGQVASGEIGNAAVLSGSIGSGQISSGHLASGLIAGLQSGGAGLVSGQVTSGFIGDAAVVSGSIASGQVSHFAISVGAINSGQVASGAIVASVLNGLTAYGDATQIASGSIRGGNIGSGAIQQGQLAGLGSFPAVLPQNIASGVIVQTAIEVQLGGASGVFNNIGPFLQTNQAISGVRAVSFLTTPGTVHEATIQIAQAGTPATMPAFGIVIQNVVSGAQVNAYTHGYVPAPMLSGTISGFHGQPIFVNQSGDLSLTQPTNSGALVQALGTAVFDQLFARVGIELVAQSWSGAVSHFQIGSGAVLSGNIGSGQIASGHLASGLLSIIDNSIILSGRIGSGAVNGFGQSGLPSAGRMVASGSIGGFDIANVAIASGHLEVNQISRRHLFAGDAAPGFGATTAWGTAIGPNNLFAGQGQMSGGAVALSTNASGFLVAVLAERQSGLRLPAIGVLVSGAVSGGNCLVITHGFVPDSFMIASGYVGQLLYVGSGGHIVTQSGDTGLASGPLQISGSVIQRIGVRVSGGMLVMPDMAITSGITTTAQGNF